MKYEPLCDYNPSTDTDYSKQTNSIWYNNPAIKHLYPIIDLHDIEIHCIHEKPIIEVLDKFKLITERFNKIILSGNYKIFCIMSWANLFTIHKEQNYIPYKKHFLSNNNQLNNIFYLFFGSSKFD